MVSPITVCLNHIYKKQGELPKEFSPFMINRFLSYNPNKKVQEMTRQFDRNSFISDKDFMGLVMYGTIPFQQVPWVNYIKTNKEKQKDIKPILQQLQKLFDWTDTELEENLPLILKEFENKTIFQEFAIKTGDPEMIKKAGIKKVGVIKKTNTSKVNLSNWM